MGLRSSKQKAEITGSPKDKKPKGKKGKKEEEINGDATKEQEQKAPEPVPETAGTVDEDSATGSGGVTAPASPDTLEGKPEPDQEPKEVIFKWPHEGKEIKITGSFNDWKEPLDMMEEDGIHILKHNLTIGQHHFKYQIDGEWTIDKDQPTEELEGHDTVNVITVSAD